MAYRKICRATDDRTFIASCFPIGGAGDSINIIFSSSHEAIFLSSILMSYIFDFISRMKLGGTNMAFFIANQLPILPPAILANPAPWQPSITLSDWLRPRVLELTYTAEDMRPFALDLGYAGEPFAWDEERRAQIRAELDAAFFHLYLPANADGGWQKCASETDAEHAGLVAAFPTPRHAVEYVMETFPITREKDMKKHGAYRTKSLILQNYDSLLQAMRDGRQWQSDYIQ